MMNERIKNQLDWKRPSVKIWIITFLIGLGFLGYDTLFREALEYFIIGMSFLVLSGLVGWFEKRIDRYFLGYRYHE